MFTVMSGFSCKHFADSVIRLELSWLHRNLYLYFLWS